MYKLKMFDSKIPLQVFKYKMQESDYKIWPFEAHINNLIHEMHKVILSTLIKLIIIIIIFYLIILSKVVNLVMSRSQVDYHDIINIKEYYMKFFVNKLENDFCTKYLNFLHHLKFLTHPKF